MLSKDCQTEIYYISYWRTLSRKVLLLTAQVTPYSKYPRDLSKIWWVTTLLSYCSFRVLWRIWISLEYQQLHILLPYISPLIICYLFNCYHSKHWSVSVIAVSFTIMVSATGPWTLIRNLQEPIRNEIHMSRNVHLSVLDRMSRTLSRYVLSRTAQLTPYAKYHSNLSEILWVP